MLTDQATPSTQEVLAANLRRLRIARHLSLSELARATGVGKATLSGVEKAHSNPTVETLAALAAALRVSVSELLEEAPLGEIRVVRANSSDAARRRLDDVATTGALELVEIRLAPRELCELEARGTGARAHVYVAQGRVLAGPVERIPELTAGDYASFPADVPHVYEAGRHT